MAGQFFFFELRKIICLGSSNKEKVIILNFTCKNRRSLLRANSPHVNVIRNQRNVIVTVPSPPTFCSGGRLLIWGYIGIVEQHSFRNVERGFERFCTCVTYVGERTEFPNFTVSARLEFKVSLSLSGLQSSWDEWNQQNGEWFTVGKLVVIIMNISTSRSLHYYVMKSIVPVMNYYSAQLRAGYIWSLNLVEFGADLCERITV